MALWAAVALGMSRMDVLGLAKLAPPPRGRWRSVPFRPFFHGHVHVSWVCLPTMNNRDLWLRTIAVASDPSDESAWVLVDTPASLLSRGPVRSHGCTVPRHCAAVVSSG